MLPLAVYIHIPFCTVKCGYCDFNAYAGMHSLAEQYRDAVLAEIDSWSDVLAGHAITSIAFGGGTPSEVPSAHIAAMIERIGHHGRLAEDCEISLEANPGTLDLGALVALREAGVTRLSLGVQSFDAEELAFLDRIHSPEANAAATRLARTAGFANLNLDLIYGLPGQSPEAFARSLRTAITLEPDHLSLYSLTVEEGTPLARRVARGEVLPLDGDDVAATWDVARPMLMDAGFEQYEVSNWARPGRESRHNSAYWTDQPYVGIGAGAHGYVGGRRYRNVDHPRTYIGATRGSDTGEHSLLGSARPAIEAIEPFDPRVDVGDWLSLRLRLARGFAPAEFQATFDAPVHDAVGPVLRDAVGAGVLVDGERIHLTSNGLMLHGEVCARLIAHLDRLPDGSIPVRRAVGRVPARP